MTKKSILQRNQLWKDNCNLEKTACKLFRTTNFSEVICFVMRCQGVDAREELEGLLKLHLEEKMPPVKISARKRVKLKCSYGGTWSQLYKLCAALKRITKSKKKNA